MTSGPLLFPRRLAWRLLAAAALVPLGVTVLFGWGLITADRASLERNLLERSRELAESASISLVEPMLVADYPVIQEVLARVWGQRVDLAFALVRRGDDDTVVADVGMGAIPPTVLAGRGLLDAGYAVRDAPILVDGDRIGEVVVGLRTDAIAKHVAERVWALAAILSVSGLVITLILATALRRWVIHPIQSLAEQAKALGRGEEKVSIALPGKDELSALAQVLEGTRKRLLASRKRLSDRNEALNKALDNLAKAVDQAQTADRLKGEFLAVVSHELRTPMNGIIGMSSLMEETVLDEEQTMFLESIQISADRLLELIDSVLDFSKIESGRLELEAIEFEIEEVARDAIQIVTPGASAKGLGISYSVKDHRPRRAIGDPHRLRQVLVNLLGNAVKYTEQGEVVLNVRFDRNPYAEGSEDPGQDLILRGEVVDTGIGIEPEALPHIFDAFRQADSSTTRRFGGTGLGLAIVSQLVELMGGEVGVESEVGMGTLFWFTVRLGRLTPATRRDLVQDSTG